MIFIVKWSAKQSLVSVSKPVTINGKVVVVCLLFMGTYRVIVKKAPDIAKWSVKTRQHFMYIFVLFYLRLQKACYCIRNMISTVEK